MSGLHDSNLSRKATEESSNQNGSGFDFAGARAAVVNRTHRVVRERAVSMQKQRSNARGLVLPLLICSALLVMVCYAVSAVVSGTGFGVIDSVETELQEQAGRLLSSQAMDTGGPMYLLLMWFLPVTAVTLAMVLFRRLRGRSDDEVTR